MRVQITLSDDYVAQIDEYAKAMGMSRSQLCAYWIGIGKMGFDKGMEISIQALEEQEKQK